MKKNNWINLSLLFAAAMSVHGQLPERSLDDLKGEADRKYRAFLELKDKADTVFEHLELPKAERKIDPCSKQILKLVGDLTQANHDQLGAKVSWLNKGKEIAQAELRQAERILADFESDLTAIQRDIDSEKKQLDNLEKSKRLIQENKTISGRERRESLESLDELIQLSNGRLAKAEVRKERFKGGESQVRIVVESADIKVAYFEQLEKALRSELVRWITYYDSRLGSTDYSCWQDRIVSLDQFRK